MENNTAQTCWLNDSATAADVGSVLSFARSTLIVTFRHSCDYPSPSKPGTETNCRSIFIAQRMTPREKKLTCILF